jgi:hypothetical protein
VTTLEQLDNITALLQLVDKLYCLKFIDHFLIWYCRATEAEQRDIVKLILSKDSGKKTLSWQKTSTKETALMIACKKGFHEIVKFIMEN